jgi:hypothetical protein
MKLLFGFAVFLGGCSSLLGIGEVPDLLVEPDAQLESDASALGQQESGPDGGVPEAGAAEGGPEITTAEAGVEAAPTVEASAPEAACGPPPSSSIMCGQTVSGPAQFGIDFGTGECSKAGHTNGLVVPTPAKCLCDYSCTCLWAQAVCSWPSAPQGPLTVLSGCLVAAGGSLVVTCN